MGDDLGTVVVDLEPMPNTIVASTLLTLEWNELEKNERERERRVQDAETAKLQIVQSIVPLSVCIPSASICC